MHFTIDSCRPEVPSHLGFISELLVELNIDLDKNLGFQTRHWYFKIGFMRKSLSWLITKVNDRM